MTRKAKQPSRKRKGRSKQPLLLQPTAEGIAQTSRFRARKYEIGAAQRGPTAPPTATRMHMELIEPIDRALGRGAAHLTAPPSDILPCGHPRSEANFSYRTGMHDAKFRFCYECMGIPLNKRRAKPRPFADQQPRILSQMEREDWRRKRLKLDSKTAIFHSQAARL